MAASSASRATPSTSYKFTMQQPSTSHAQLQTGYEPDTLGGRHIVGRPRARITFLFVESAGHAVAGAGATLKLPSFHPAPQGANAAICCPSFALLQTIQGGWLAAKKAFGDNAAG